MMKKSEIQLTINILTRQFKADVDSDFTKGRIVAYREILGEDGLEVLQELHQIRRSIMIANGEI